MTQGTWQEITAPARAIMRPGRKVRLFFQEGNHNNGILHVRAVVDDDWVIVRRWSRRKQAWVYQVECIYLYVLHLEGGHLSDAGKSEDRPRCAP